MIHRSNERSFYFCFRCHANDHDSESCPNPRKVLQENRQKQIEHEEASTVDDSKESGFIDDSEESQPSHEGADVETSIAFSLGDEGAQLQIHAPRQCSTNTERRDGGFEGRRSGFRFIGNRGSGFGALPRSTNFTDGFDVSANVIRRTELRGRSSEERMAQPPSVTPVIENRNIRIPSPDASVTLPVAHNEEHSLEVESEPVREYSDDGWDSPTPAPVQTVASAPRAFQQTRPTGRGFGEGFGIEFAGLTIQGNNTNNNSTKRCYCCNGQGHLGRDCPKYAARGKMSRSFKRCSICKQYSHETSNCPEPTRQARGCFNCGEKGHISFECPKPLKRIDSLYCYNCERKGHLDVACRKPLKKPEPCANCGKMDHTTADCPEHAGAEQGPLFDRLLEVPVIVNDVANEQAIVPRVSFEDLKFVEQIYANIERLGFTDPTPIQQNAIPIIQRGDDLLACACSGSGKSAAFLLPIISKLVEENDNDVNNAHPNPSNVYNYSSCFPRCLVITPTHELAQQIYEEAGRFALTTKLTRGVAYGGKHMSRQRMELSNGAAVLVATPGRLIHLVDEKIVSLEKLRFLVLDEADRMIATNFSSDICNILEKIPNKSSLQTLMFSMTFSRNMEDIPDKFLKEGYAKVIVDAVGAANKCIQQNIILCRMEEKINKLMELLNMKLDINVKNGLSGGQIVESTLHDKTVIFVERKQTAQSLFERFKSHNGVHVITSIHSDLTQRERTQNLHDFEYSKKGILIATGVAERGLELKHIDHVINYDLPDSIDTYVHRIGRSGRRGNEGKATSLYSSFRDRRLAKDLVECMKKAEQAVPSWLDDEASK